MIAIIDYEAGNLTSVRRAFAALSVEAEITRDHKKIMAAGRVVFPGVGNAESAMHSLEKYGLDGVLRQVYQAGKPLLGICLGSQIVLEHSQEGDISCLKLLPGQALRFPANMSGPDGRTLKVPHMGWNSLRPQYPHPLLQGLHPQAQFYFVHSYYPSPARESDVLARTSYGVSFASMLAHNNLAATQFHLEKSGQAGLRILANFAAWRV